MAQSNWMSANPGKVITIHDLASLTNAAYHASVTAKNMAALLSLVYGHSHNLSSLKGILRYHLLHL
jgi:predicted phosphodiesterase